MKNALLPTITFLVLATQSLPLHALQTLAAGGGHSCAIQGGNLYCWGSNYSGQLGTGDHASAWRPVRIEHPPGKAWVGVNAGYAHTCALDDSSTAYCWGANDGRLGNGSVGDDVLAPAEVIDSGDRSGLKKVTDISAGSRGTCATVDGKIACWGDNYAGQLGDNSNSPSPLPVPLLTPVGVSHIAGGVAHACANTSGLTLYCWGSNFSGQLGDGTKNDSGVPIHVFDQILDVTVSDNATCAIGYARALGNRLFCWGQNSYGQLGNNSNSDSVSPVVVLNPDGSGSLDAVSAVTLGGFSTCAIDASGHAYCWGYGGHGQLGDGTGKDSTLPVSVRMPNGAAPLGDVVEISNGWQHACARKSDNTILCWGRDEGAGLGNGTSGNQMLPVEIDFDEIFSNRFE